MLAGIGNSNSETQPIFQFINATPFDLVVASATAWIDSAGNPHGPSMVKEQRIGSGVDDTYFLASSVGFDILESNTQNKIGSTSVRILKNNQGYWYLQLGDVQNSCQWSPSITKGMKSGFHFWLEYAGTSGGDTPRSMQRLKCDPCSVGDCGGITPGDNIPAFGIKNSTPYDLNVNKGGQAGKNKLNPPVDTTIKKA